MSKTFQIPCKQQNNQEEGLSDVGETCLCCVKLSLCCGRYVKIGDNIRAIDLLLYDHAIYVCSRVINAISFLIVLEWEILISIAK